MKSFISHLNESMVDDLLSTQIRKAIKSAGGKIYQIGGVVRDEMIGKISKDLDIIIVGIELDDIEKILKPHGKVNMVGKSFGILKFVPTGSTEAEDVDISVPRIDSKSTGSGHKDFEVELGKGITLQQDQLRRDFWINALAKDVDTGEIIDVDGKGMKDIKNKQIRMISPTSFEDDPLRMFRAVQFASRFDFTIEKETYKEMKKRASTISTISADRFQEEFKKLFSKSKKPSIGVKILFDSGLMKHIFKSIKLKSNDLKTIDALGKSDFAVFMGILLSDYGNKAGSTAKTVIRLSNTDAKIVQNVVDWKEGMNNVELANYAKSVDVRAIDAFLSAKGSKTLSSRLKGIKYISVKDMPIDGRDAVKAGFKGKAIGDVLQSALDYSIKTGKSNKEDLLKHINSKNKR